MVCSEMSTVSLWLLSLLLGLALACVTSDVISGVPQGSEVARHGVSIYGFYSRNRNCGLGYILHMLVLGPLGVAQKKKKKKKKKNARAMHR